MTAKKFDLSKYKESIQQAEVPLKKDQYIHLHDCLHELMGMPGLPQGHISQIYGKSDTGKTSLLFHIAAQAQAQGILPILIITEGKVDWERAKMMGFDEDNAIVEQELEFIEDIYDYMQRRITDIQKGDLPTDVIFLWDSIGNTQSQDEIEVDKDGYVKRKKGMQVAARAHSQGLRTFSKMINNTRKEGCPHFASAVFINTGYNKPPTFPGAPTTFVPYGGDKIWYGASLIIKTARKGKLEATKDKKKVIFGLTTKIAVEKNHINGISLAGEFAIAADEILPYEPTAIKDYKERNKDKWGDLTITHTKAED
jgi:RecA/RadA recombinase